MLSWFANCIVPAKLGDAYRAYLLKAHAGVSFSKTFGTILAERIIDMLLLFIAAGRRGAGRFSGTLPAEVMSIMQVGLVLVVLVVIGLVAMRNLGGIDRAARAEALPAPVRAVRAGHARLVPGDAAGA